MKRIGNGYIIVALLLVSIFLLPFCTKNDQVLDVPDTTINSGTDLVSVKVTTAPTIDGTIDALWENSPKLQFSTAVPEVTGDVFRGYQGNIIPSVTMRSAYDATNIYFLVEWADPTQSLQRNPWYYNDTSTVPGKKWFQEISTYQLPPYTYRPPFYEDKAAFLWNINNSVSGWASGTCYKSCHTGLPKDDGYSRHYTNYPSEKIDMWHWKSVRGGVNAGNQIHDQVQNNSYPNGRTSDSQGDVYQANSQTLGGVLVPKYIIPGRNNYNWIMNADTTTVTKRIIAVNGSNGVLTLSDGTTIDPNVGTDYKRIGAGVGPKVIPGVMLNAAYTGSQGDISCKAIYTGTGWILEFTRLLKTADAVNDIDFTSLDDQYFGFAIFENAQIAHSIKPNLVLKFKK